MSESKLPSDIDRNVGQRVRWRRRELKLTQEKLGDMLDLTFQQVQKYEKGVNRISAGRLYEMAAVLGVPVTYFYEGVGEIAGRETPQVAQDIAPSPAPIMDDDTLELINAYQKIDDVSLRKSLLSAIRSRSDFIFTSESVAEGHPDKVCDRVSDEIVDLFFRKAEAAKMDPWDVRVACETMTTTNRTCLAGEVRGPKTLLTADEKDFTEEFKAEMEATARNAVKSIGYEQDGYHWETMDFANWLHGQSIDIAAGVDAGTARTYASDADVFTSDSRGNGAASSFR